MDSTMDPFQRVPKHKKQNWCKKKYIQIITAFVLTANKPITA